MRRLFVLLACLLVVLATGGVLAQEATPEAQPEATEAPTALPPTEVPTEIPTEVPPVVTVEPTAEITPVVTAEATAEATLPVEITPIVSPTAPALPPEPILALLTRAMFDNGDMSAWILGANWFVIPNETGMGLQIANAADSLQLVQGPFYNAAAQVDLRLTGGSLHLSLRQSDVGAYSVALDAAGQLTLYRADVPVQSVTLALPANSWQTLRLSAIQDIIRVAVNGTEVFAWQDTAPLPPGFAKIAALPPVEILPFSAQVDNFFLWVPETELALYPTPTLPPPAPTAEPPVVVTPEVTSVVTAEPTAEITPVVTAEPTEELVGPTGKSLVAQSYIPPVGASITDNNNLSNIEQIVGVPYTDTGDTTGNTVEAGEPNPNCGFNITATAWYQFVSTGVQTYVLSTAGSQFDTILAVYSGATAPTTGAVPVKCSDDITAADSTSSVDLTTAAAGTIYWIQLGGYNSAHGNYIFTMKQKVVAKPGVPVVKSPATGYPTNNPAVIFTWTPSTGTTLTDYELQVSTVSTFATLAYSKVILPTVCAGSLCTFTLPTTSESGYTLPLTDNTYYWRLRSRNVNGESNAWATARTFIIDTSNAGLVQPVLTAPVNGAAITATRPTLTWKAVTGAAKYRVFLADAANPGTSLILAGKEVVTTPTLALAATVMTNPLTHGKTYNWRVEAGDAAGNFGPVSATFTFTINLMNAPVDGFSAKPATFPLAQAFSWVASGITGASYTVQVATVSDFSGTLYTCTSTSTTCTLATTNRLPAVGTYFWRLLVSVGGVTQVATPPFRTFVLTDEVIPTAPTLVSPPTAKPVSLNFLMWKAPTTPATGVAGYEVQVSSTNSFATLIPGTLNDVTFEPNLTVDGTYYWRVRARNNDGAYGPWSAVWSFIYDTTNGEVIGSPQLTAPSGTITATRPTLTWKAVTGAKQYRVTITSDAFGPGLPVDFLPGKNTVTTTSLALAATVIAQPLEHGVEYTWTVEAGDAAGNFTPASAPMIFTVNLMNAPAAGAGLKPTAVTAALPFTWFTSGITLSGLNYTVQVSQDNTFGSGVETCTATTLTCSIPANPARTAGVYYWRLLVRGFEPLTGLPYRSFTLTSVALPAAPTPLTPVNAKPTNMAAFTWKAPTGAAPSSYELQISASKTFDSLVGGAPVYNGTSATSDFTAVPNGTYYWRVRGANAENAGGAWSAVWSFIYDTVGEIVTAPDLLTPANNSTITAVRPTLTWKAVTGAAKYRVFLADAANPGTSLILAGKEVVTTPTLALAATVMTNPLTHGKTYNWRVEAGDAAGNFGPVSATFAITVNLMNTPANGASIKPAAFPAAQAFAWVASGITGVTNYTVQVATTSSFSPVLFTCTSTTTTCTLPVGQRPATAGTYFWRLLVNNGVAPQVATPPYRSFVLTDEAIPTAPTPLTPANAKPVSNNPALTLTWKAPTTGTIWAYEVQIATKNTFVGAEIVDGGFIQPAALTFSPTLLTQDGTYYWRVRAQNNDAAAGPWSAVWSFIYDNVATDLPAPVQLTPTNYSSVVTDKPTFTWKAVTGAAKYEIQLSTEADFSSLPPYSYYATSTSLVPTGPLLYKTYIWRVRALDAAGNASAQWSKTFRVTVTAPTTAVPVLNRFGNEHFDADLNNGVAELTWTPISWATGYEVQIDDANVSNNLVAPFIYVKSDITPGTLKLSIPTTLGNGTYYWRVHAKKADGTWGTWSSIGIFQIDRTP